MHGIKPVQGAAVARDQIAVILDAGLALDHREAQVAEDTGHRAHDTVNQGVAVIDLALKGKLESGFRDVTPGISKK